MSGNRTIVLTQEEVTLVAESWLYPACHREQPSFLRKAVLAVRIPDAVYKHREDYLGGNRPPVYCTMNTAYSLSRQRFFNIFTTGLLLFYLVLAVNLGEKLPSFENLDYWGLVAFLALAILSEIYPLRIPLGHATMSMSGIIFWALIVLFNPVIASIVTFCAILISEIISHRSFIKTAFNSTQTAVSTLIGGLVFVRIAGGSGLVTSLDFLLAFLIGAFIYWIANTVQVSIAAKLLYNENPYMYWRKNFQWAFVYELTSAPVALAVAFSYQELSIIGLLLVTLPIFMVRLAYSQYLELKKTYRETVRTLVKIIEMHDPYTAGHSDRVATYANRMCESLRLSPVVTEKIELAAFLHDLGKIHLDLSNIIRKAGKLNEEERRLIKLHSVVSADLANQVSYFKGEIEAMIRHHHENWDGTGYPHGLKGEQIPLGSRIILLADAFDAMTTSRVYRDALDLERVKDEFRKFAGIQFDPRLVPVFLEQVVGDGSELPRQPMDEPLEGQRARMEAAAMAVPKVHDIKSRVIG